MLDAAKLVFRTLRVGFPDNPVVVYGNGLEWFEDKEVEACAKAAGATYQHWARRTSHDAWLEALIMDRPDPFWICDTDVVFFDQAGRDWEPHAAFAGEMEQEFFEEWTDTIHMERLHTCVMWIDPVAVRMAMRAWMSRIPLPWGATAQMNLVRQMFVPSGRGRTMFYDTCAGLWHAGIGAPFGAQRCEAWEHLHCATYADEASRAPGLRDMQKIHQAIYAEPQRARGLREKQAEYYKSRSTKGAELCHMPPG